MTESPPPIDDDPSTVTRRAFTKSLGLGLFATGVGRAAAETKGTRRWVVGTESSYGTDFVVQQSDAVEKTVDLGSMGDAIVGQFDPATAAQLQKASSTRYVEKDVSVTFPAMRVAAEDEGATLSTNGQRSPWGCERIGAMPLHGNNITGDGVDVAVIDSGIDSNHPDLKANLGKGYAVTSCGGDECRSEWDDDHTHGTHCAGIVGAANNDRGVVGVAPDVTLHAVKVMTAAGSGSGSDIAEGIVWAADNGCDVANVSLGATSPAQVIHDAIKYAEQKGMLVVAAAGNEGPCSDCLHYPGAYEETLCVGAINDEDELADYSSTGDAVDLVAPGTEIPSTVIGGEYRAFSGTSMATPHVVGAAALLVRAGYSPQEAKQRLLETAEDLGFEAAEGGRGLVDCDAALSGGGVSPSGAVETGSVTRVRHHSATVTGQLTRLIGTESATVGVEYWPAEKSPAAANRVDAGTRSAPGEFEAELTDLDRDTDYRYRAVCSGEASATGSTRSFTTRAHAPTVDVTTDGVSDATATGAVFEGELTTLKGVDTATVGFEYWAEGDREGTVATTEAVERTSTGTFTQSVDGLAPDTTYVVRARASPAGGKTIYGAETTFTTADGLSVSVNGTTDIDLYGATLEGELTSLGTADEADVGFQYWERGDSEGPSETSTHVMESPGTFESDAGGLQSETEYVFEAFARSDSGKTVTSDRASFTTDGTSW
jgi:subtilisin